MPHSTPTAALKAPTGQRGFIQYPVPFSMQETQKRSRHGFTLVEVLVATSVLTLMVLMLTALMNSAMLTITAGNRHLAADDQARQVFDRMQVDFARMLKRNDIYFNFAKQTGNDSFTFYAETPGYFTSGTSSSAESNSSLVSYQIPLSGQLTPATQSMANMLCRLGQGSQWTDISFTPSQIPAYSISNAHILSNSIFRMESAFLYRTSDTTLQISSNPPTPGSNFQNLEAIIVALGVLDSDSQKLVPASAYSSLVTALPDYAQPSSQTITLSSASSPVASTIDPILSSWRAAISATTFAQTAGIPAVAAQHIRVYQRIIYLQ